MTSIPNRLVLATRGSKLALRQTEIVASLLRGAHSGIEIELKVITTRGDSDRRSFGEIGGKGLFVAEVEREVAEGRADAAVHSAKDLTAVLAPDCEIICVPERAAAHDVIVGGAGDTGEERLGSLAAGARVGTSSMRRRALLAEARDDLEVVELRGNLDTRLRKVVDGEAEAAVLAAAGLERLGTPDRGAPLDESWWVPAPAQGALAIQARSDRLDVAAAFAPLNDALSMAEVLCERAFAAHLEGGCSVPLGCRARATNEGLSVIGYLGDPFGSGAFRDRISGSIGEAEDLGRELAKAILDAGGAHILADISSQDAPEVTPP